jgi:imidazolonepropionase-like amidohydrolase
MWGKKVAAHAHGAEGIKRAARAGVASIEHGGMIDEEGVRLLKEKGVYLVTIGLPPKLVEKEKELRKNQLTNWKRAIAAGVKLAFGTDAGVYPHGQNAKQFHSLLAPRIFGERASGTMRPRSARFRSERAAARASRTKAAA